MGDFNKIDGKFSVPLPGRKWWHRSEEKEGAELFAIFLAKDGEITGDQRRAVAPRTPVSVDALEGDPAGYVENMLDGGALRLRGRVRHKIKGDYEDWLEYRARKRVFDMRPLLDAKEYHDSMAAVQEECASGTFAWGGSAWDKSLQQFPGIVKMITLLARDAGENVDESRVIELLEAGAPLVEGLRTLLDAQPNFLSPPIRGRED